MNLSNPADTAPDYIRNLPRYVPGKPASEVKREQASKPLRLHRMASNENPLGVSAKALAAMQGVMADAANYPDPSGHQLKARLSARLRVEAQQLVLGNGSSELLDLAARCFLRAGDEAVYSQYAFQAYPVAIHAVGATPVCVPARDYGHDLDAMRAAITERTKLVFIANPNNPTGTLLDAGALQRFVASVPRHILVVLDEAYGEFLPDVDALHSCDWIAEHPHLLVLRTFSKAYGLAGMRVGYGVAHPAVADLLNRLRLTFNTSAMAQAAAEAAFDDADFLQRSRGNNAQGMVQLEQGLQGLGLPFIRSHANFIAIDVSSTGRTGAEVAQQLLAAGVIVRPLGANQLPQFIRVTVGLPEDNVAFLGALKQVLS
nr:histidinol-phosphate transaminase [uncultured Roseateles sp.]